VPPRRARALGRRGYRAGVAEGLFLDREGYVDANPWGVREAAIVLASHPDASAVLDELSGKIRQAGWAHRFAESTRTRGEVVAAMREMSAVLPSEDSRRLWDEIAGRLSGPTRGADQVHTQGTCTDRPAVRGYRAQPPAGELD